MSFLVTRGLGAGNLVTAGLAVQLGTTFFQSTVGALALGGTVATVFIEGEADTRNHTRLFLGTFFGTRHQ